MKKTVAFILIVALVCSFGGCFAKMTPVETFIIACTKMDITAMCAELVPDDATGSLYLKLKNANPDEDALAVLRALYSLVQYTMGEVSSDGGEQTVSVTLKAPDMERIRSLAITQTLVSGDSAAEAIRTMLDDGSISRSMMKEYSLTVKMTETDGAWKIPCADKENADFMGALALAEMIDFLA